MIDTALILAAGVGSRLRHMTHSLPKALVPVNNIPTLKRQIDSLALNKIKTVNVVCGFEGIQIKDFIEKEYATSSMNFNIIENVKYASTNSAYSFWLAYENLEGKDFIHMNCDTIFTDKVINSLLKSSKRNILITRRQKLGDNMEQVMLDNDRIIKMRNMHFQEAELKAMGLAKISNILGKKLFEDINTEVLKGKKNGNFYGVIRNAVSSFEINSIEATEEIFEINTLSEFEAAHEKRFLC